MWLPWRYQQDSLSDALGRATRAAHALAYIVYRAKDSTGRKQGTRLGQTVKTQNWILRGQQAGEPNQKWIGCRTAGTLLDQWRMVTFFIPKGTGRAYRNGTPFSCRGALIQGTVLAG